MKHEMPTAATMNKQPPKPQTRYSLRNTHQKYTYTPLPDSPDSIRLLILHPSSNSVSPLKCSLFTTTLSTAPPYVALSYAWGAATTKQAHSLIISSSTSNDPKVAESQSTLSITTSLHHALHRLRREKTEIVMWVDAVCINQSDIPERNIQTGRMREIYVNAASVAVWLGLEYMGSQEALGLVREIMTLHEVSHPSERDWQMEELLEKEEENLRALVRLFRRQYWWRIWVIQEVTCGRRSVVYCGDDEMAWETLDGVCNIFKTHEAFLRKIFYQNQSYVRTLVAGGPKGLQLSRYSDDATHDRNGPMAPLLDLLISHKGKRATEPRDKVFALLGISASWESFGKIDYSAPLRDVYTYTARHIIESTGRLDVICIKQNFRVKDKIKTVLPSWAPDWRRQYSNLGSSIIGLHHREPVFRACRGRSCDFKFFKRGEEDVLCVTGIVVDTITKVGPPLVKKANPNDPVPPLRAVIAWWNLYVERFGESSEAMASFGRVLSCGTWNEDDESTIAKVVSIFALTEALPVDDETEEAEDAMDVDPPSRPVSRRSSSMGISRTTTMTSSTSFPDDDEDGDFINADEREQLGTILSASLMMNRRRLIISNRGFVGLGLWDVEEGDLICVLLGCRFPVVLRLVEDGYMLLGEAYVDGIMDGEVIDGVDSGKYNKETLEIC